MKTFRVCLMTIFIFSNTIAQINSHSEAYVLTTSADSSFRYLKFRKAVDNYMQAAQINEKNKEWFNCVKCLRLASNALVHLSKFDSALVFLNRAQELSINYFSLENTEERIEKIEILQSFGKIKNRAGQYKEELSYYLQAAELLNNQINDVKKASVLNKLATSYINLDKFDEAEKHLSKAAQLLENTFADQELVLAENYIAFGNIDETSGKYKDAIAKFNKALEIRKSHLGNNHPEISETYTLISNALEKIQEFDKALEYNVKAQDIYKNVYGIECLQIADCFNDLAIIYNKRGKYSIGLEYLLKALKIKIAYLGPENIEIAWLYHNIGVLYYMTGNYNETIEYCKKSIRIKTVCIGTKNSDIAKTYNTLGNAYEKIYEHKKAFEYYNLSLDINKGLFGEVHPMVAMNYTNIGKLYLKEKDYKKAMDFTKKSLDLRIILFGEKHAGVSDCYSRLGDIYLETGKHDSAIYCFKKSLKIDTVLFGKNHPMIARDFWNIGKTFSSWTKYSESLEYFQKGLVANSHNYIDTFIYSNPNSVSVFLAEPMAHTLLNDKALALYYSFLKNHSKRDLEHSINTFQIVFELIDTMRMNFNSEAEKLLLSHNTKNYYFEAINAATEYVKATKSEVSKEICFSFIEKSKSAVLSALVNSVNTRLDSFPLDLAIKEKELKNNLNRYLLEIEKNKKDRNDSETGFWENEFFKCSRKYDSIITLIKTNFPSYYETKFSNKNVSIAELKSKLYKNSVLLDYAINDTSIIIAVITDSIFETTKIWTKVNLKNATLDYFKSIKKADSKNFLKQSQMMYDWLIKPVEKYISEKEHIIIIPDDYLYYIPFETLIDKLPEKPNDVNFSDLNFLLKSHSITYNHSATLWFNSREANIHQKSNFIGYAPVFRKEINNGTIISSNFNVIDTTENTIAYRSSIDNSQIFNPLPYSEEEVKSIVRLFEKKKKEAKAYLYIEANEKNFKDNLTKYSFIHISSHGFANDKEPALSGIVFSQPLDTGSNEDGILFSGEVYNLNSDADLMVLSSCESGIGKLAAGEGFMALSRGFLYSGVPNIIFSLWKTLDKPSKDLMIEFYTNILEGKSYSESLRLAKLSMIKNGGTSFPHFWAGFMLVGR